MKNEEKENQRSAGGQVRGRHKVCFIIIGDQEKRMEGKQKNNQMDENILMCISSIQDLLAGLQVWIPKTLQYATGSNAGKDLSKKIYGCGVKTITNHASANLKALAYVFLIICCKNDEDDRLITTLLVELATIRDSFDQLINLPFNPQQLSNANLPEFVEEIFNTLADNQFEKTIFEILDHFFGMVEILALFFRALLIKLKYPGAHNYSEKLNTQQTFVILTDYFDISFESQSSYYLFREDGMFIASHDDVEFSFGRYYDNASKLYQSEEIIKKNALQLIEKLNSRSMNFHLHADLSKSFNIISMDSPASPSSPKQDSSLIPTPNFGGDENKLQVGEETPKQQQNSMLSLDAFGNYSFKFDYFENKLLIQNQQKKQSENERNQAKKLDISNVTANTAINLANLPYKNCDTDRQFWEDSQENKDRIQIYSPCSQNLIEAHEELKFMSDIPLQESEKKQQKKREEGGRNIVSNSYHQESQSESRTIRNRRTFFVPDSTISCCCTAVKQEKNIISSKVIDLRYQPVPSKRSKVKKQYHELGKKASQINCFSPNKVSKNNFRSSERQFYSNKEKQKIPTFLQNRLKKTNTNIQCQQVKQRYWQQKQIENTRINSDNRRNLQNNARSQPIFKYMRSPTTTHKIVQRPQPVVPSTHPRNNMESYYYQHPPHPMPSSQIFYRPANFDPFRR